MPARVETGPVPHREARYILPLLLTFIAAQCSAEEQQAQAPPTPAPTEVPTPTQTLPPLQTEPPPPYREPTSTPERLPADIRGALPEEIARATEEAMRPSPTPDRRFREPQLSDIKIEQELFAHCAPYSEDPTGNDMWGGWIVRLDNPDYYLRHGTFEMELLTPSGGFITTERLPGIALASGMPDYIPAFIEPTQGQRELFGATTRMVLSGEGSRLGSIRLRPAGQMEWAPVDNSPNEYRWNDEFLEGGYSAQPVTIYGQPYVYPDGRAPRSFWVGITNTGDRVIQRPHVFGFVTDAEGNLVDILSGYAQDDIPFDGGTAVEARSVSNGGRCTAPPSEGLTLSYWVYSFTYTGMPLARYYEMGIGYW